MWTSFKSRVFSFKMRQMNWSLLGFVIEKDMAIVGVAKVLLLPRCVCVLCMGEGQGALQATDKMEFKKCSLYVHRPCVLLVFFLKMTVKWLSC